MSTVAVYERGRGATGCAALPEIRVTRPGGTLRTRVRLACPLVPGEQVQIALWPPRGVRSVRLPATICWCRTNGGVVLAGVRLRERLSPRDVAKLGV